MLQGRAADRNAAHMSSNEYHNFMGMIMDCCLGLLNWITDGRKYLTLLQPKCCKLNEHDNLKAEIGPGRISSSRISAISTSLIEKLRTAY